MMLKLKKGHIYPGRIKFEGKWESGQLLWTDLETGSSFTTKTSQVVEVLDAVVEVRRNYQEAEASHDN